MTLITIQTTAMGFRVGVSPKGIIKGTQVLITEYSRKFEQWEFDRQTNMWTETNQYFRYYRDIETMIFAKYDLSNFIAFMRSKGVDVKVDQLVPEIGADTKIMMLPHIAYKNNKQKGAVEYLSAEDGGELRGLAIQTGAGKGICLDEPVLTDRGWVEAGSLKVHDYTVGPTGGLYAITGIYPQGAKSVYRINLVDGSSTRCCSDHLWKVYDRNSNTKVVELNTFIDRFDNVFIPVSIFGEIVPTAIESIEYIGLMDTVCISVDHPENLYIVNDYIVTHNTVSYIWSLANRNKRAMTLMTSRLEQWVAEFGVYTNLEAEDIYVVSGIGSLTKLFDKIDEINPQSILVSVQTLRKYMEYGPAYSHLPHPTLMCEKLGIGIVGNDEFHEHFNTNFLIYITLNPALFIPITATFTVNDSYAKNIFDKFVPENIQFVGGEYDRYVNITAYGYRTSSSLIRPFHYQSGHGYSQIKLEAYLTSKKGRQAFENVFHDCILPMVRDHYLSIAEDGEKMLFLCSTQKFCDLLEKELSRHINSKKITTFYSGMPVSKIEKNDIILSTPGSAGTGRDIGNLIMCFAFENTASENRNLQFLGRLRKPKKAGRIPEFVYLYFTGIPQHVNYANKRSILYGPRGLTFKHRYL